MNVNAVTDQTTSLNRTTYVREVPTVRKSSGGFLEKPKDDLDLLMLSEQLRNQMPAEGLFIPYDPTAPVEEPEKIKITTVPLSDIKYNGCKESAKKGFISDYFFHLDSSPLIGQAQKIANGEEYDPDDADTRNFIRGLNEFFAGSDKTSIEESFKQMALEYADALKSGKSMDISQLKTTFSLAGEEISMGQVLDMSETAAALAEVDYGNGSGTSMYIGFAELGLIKAGAAKYGNTLPEGVGKAFEEKMKNLADNALSSRIQDWK